VRLAITASCLLARTDGLPGPRATSRRSRSVISVMLRTAARYVGRHPVVAAPCVPKGRRRGGHVFRVLLRAGQTGAVTSEQLELISADPRVMHGQAVIAGTRVPVSVILDCLAAGMTAEQITAEYPTVTVAGVRAAAAYGAALAREELLPIPPSR
jgi:uncharacterized protein (DUF433 family)